MGSLTFDFLTESFLFSEDLIAEQFASIPEHDLEQELQRYRAFCICNEKSLLSEVRPQPSNLKVFSGLGRVSLDQLKQSALYVEQYVIDDPLVPLTAGNSELGKAMNKLLGMQARSVDKADLTHKIRFLKTITPMVAAGFVKLLPVSMLFDPPRETPIFYSDNYFEDALPAEVLKIFREHALVKSLRRMERGWRIEEELFPCRAIYIKFQGHTNENGVFCTYHDKAVNLNEEDRTLQFTITMPDSPPSPERFAVWVRQSVNRSAQDLYTQTFHELILSGSIGALYCTKSELLADVLTMQFPPSDTIRANTASAIMSLELPFLANVDAEKLMKVRTEEGHAFQNFRTELDKQLRDLRSINDPEQASRKAKDAVHELTMVQIRDISNKLESLKEKLWFKAAMGTVGLLAAVQTSGASLLASASAVVEPVLEYRKEIKRHPAFFLWKILKR